MRVVQLDEFILQAAYEFLRSTGGTELQYFGYPFEVPWEDLDTAGLKIGKKRAVLPFRSGVLLSFLSGSNHEFVDGLSENTSVEPEAFRAVYGTQALQTDYEFYKLMLRATPDMVKPFGSRRDVVAGMMLVIVKAMAVPEDSGIFEVDTGEFRGFQYGDLRTHPKRVVVDLCSADRKVELVFIRPDKKPLDISQADVNRVIQTLHRSDVAAPTKNLS